MPNLTVLINAFFENIMNGRDPNEVMFNRTGCFDVGHACGGWGHVTVEMRDELRWPRNWHKQPCAQPSARSTSIKPSRNGIKSTRT